jgi:hypothetical protein
MPIKRLVQDGYCGIVKLIVESQAGNFAAKATSHRHDVPGIFGAGHAATSLGHVRLPVGSQMVWHMVQTYHSALLSFT